MPVSKKRKKKNGAVAKFKRDRYVDEDLSGGVSLQDLINMVAYQEYQQAGEIDNVAIPDTNETDPKMNEEQE